MSPIRVEVLSGPEQGTVHVLSGIAIIGRDPTANVTVSDPMVSRQHAVIRADGAGFVIEDLDSRSGTLVNGVRTRKALLLDGDRIQAGGLELRVLLTDRAAGEVAPNEVKMVTSRHLATQRLSLDKVRFRTGELLSDSGGSLPSLQPAGRGATANEHAAPAPPASAPGAAGPAATPDAGRRLELLGEIARSLAAVHERGRLTRETTARIVEMFPGVRRIGFFELVDDPGAEQVLRPSYLVDRSRRAAGEPVQVSETVLRAAIRERQAILSQDVRVDPRFRQAETLQVAGVCSMVCVPLCLGERVLGALYVDSTDPQARLDGTALRLLSAVAAVVAAAFEHARLFARVQAESVRRASLERYFSPDLVERVLRGDLPLAREGRLTHGTILFVDIRGFSRLTVSTDPTVLVATLNAYFEAMQRIVFRSRGTVERFGGDSILAYWGVVDQGSDGTARSMRAALAMQVELFRLNPELRAAGRPSLEVGVGLNTGEIVAGDVGSAERYEFTILGDAVNMARRYEALAGPWEVIAGAGTVDDLGPRLLHRPLPPVKVKGKDEAVRVSLVHGLRVDAGRGPERRYELAIPGQLHLPDGRAETLISGLVVSGERAALEVLTPRDPQPGVPARVELRLPRHDQVVLAEGRILPESVQDTQQLGPSLAVSGSGLQRVRLELAHPAPALRALGL